MSKNYDNTTKTTDFCAFIDWLWAIDPGLGVKVQELHDLWRRKVARSNQRSPLEENEFIIDGRYRVRFNPPESQKQPAGYLLFNLMEPGDNLIAVYHDYAALVSDLLAHSTSRSGHQAALDLYTKEVNRLIGVCNVAWQQFASAER